jgi:hypothetical protein
MTTPNADLSRWLHLTLLGDTKAAASLLIHAKRLNDPLLSLVAQVVCRPVSWDRSREVLDTLPAAALSPEVASHLSERLPQKRIMMTYYDKSRNPLLTSVAVRAPAATLHLMTDLLLSASPLDLAAWEALCAAPLPSLRRLDVTDSEQRLSLALLDPVSTPWLSGLHRLSLCAYGQRQPLTQATHDALNALLARMTQHPAMALTSLNIDGYQVTLDSARALGSAPWARQLVSLGLNHAELPSVALRSWADAPLSSLRALSIHNQPALQTADIVAFAASPRFVEMEQVSLVAVDLLEAARLTLTSARAADPVRRCLLLLPCGPDVTKPQRALVGPNSDAQVAALGRLLRPHLATLTRALPEEEPEVPLRLIKGMERALACIAATLTDADAAPLSVPEQAEVAALVLRCARTGALVAATLTLYLPHLTDVSALSALAAALLRDKSTRVFAFLAFRALRTPPTDPTCAAIITAIQLQATLAALSQPTEYKQHTALGALNHPPLRAALTPWLWASLRDLDAPGPGVAALPEMAWPPLAAPDGIFRALWTALSPDDTAQALTLLRHGVGLRFACDAFYLSAALSRADLLPALLSGLDLPTRQRLLTRLSSRTFDAHTQARPRPRPRLIHVMDQALTDNAALRAYLPPLATDWPRPTRGRGRAHWATLATLNLTCVVSAEGEAARPLLVSLLDSDEPLTCELAQQRLDLLDRRQRQAAAEGAPSAPTEPDR